MSDDHLIPNTTQVPNCILDLLMPFLNEGEGRVLLYLCRRTYGFQKQTDAISLDQFVHGIKGESRQLDFGAGISRQGAMNALAVLKAIEIVEQIQGGRGRGNIPVYRLNIKCEIVQWLDLIAQEPETAREKIVERLDLIRQKSLPYGPFHKKSTNDKASQEKVEMVDLLEKVETDAEKGLTVRPTKPSNTKPSTKLRKEIPPENAYAFSSPTNEGGSQWMREWPKARRFPKDYPRTPPAWFLVYTDKHCPHVDVPHEWEYMLDQTFKSPRTQFFMVARRWMETEEEKRKQNGARASPGAIADRVRQRLEKIDQEDT